MTCWLLRGIGEYALRFWNKRALDELWDYLCSFKPFRDTRIQNPVTGRENFGLVYVEQYLAVEAQET